MKELAWNPDLYHHFREQRAQPFLDLMDGIEARPGMRVLDLGCGTGELTRDLHLRFAAAETIGVDRSVKMLERASVLDEPGLKFCVGDLEDPQVEGDFDLIVSNAALQWSNHQEQCLTRWRGLLAAHGQLAVQVPAAFDMVPHQVAREVAAREPFHSALEGYRRGVPILRPEEYAQVLYRLGFTRQTVRLQVYAHLLAGPEEVVDWVRGTLLLDYQRRLPDELQEKFVDAYREALLAQVSRERPFFFPYNRLLFWGSLP